MIRMTVGELPPWGGGKKSPEARQRQQQLVQLCARFVGVQPPGGVRGTRLDAQIAGDQPPHLSRFRVLSGAAAMPVRPDGCACARPPL